ncbi:MAG: hypothetical protein ABIH03_05140 [Pseudomonadota bacterium]
MKQGEQIDFSGHWRPTGEADAVFYLDACEVAEEIVNADGCRVISRVVLQPSLVEEAMRYLAPCSQDWYDDHPGQHGIRFFPDLKGQVGLIPGELREAASKLGVQVQHQMRSDGVLAENPMLLKEARRVRWEKARDGIWCVFCEARSPLSSG